ncbi:MAG: phosphatase PAP2 family protein [Gemmatimonadaceae bacterium]|nr:phosphatase PAP2 family protein [Chitinophagaceae bacterium]
MQFCTSIKPITMNKRNMIKVLTFVFGVAMFATGCSTEKKIPNRIEQLPATAVLEWNDIAYNAFGGPLYQHSLQASRINAMTHLAMHDALNSIQAKYATYAFKGKDSGADPISAAVTAAHSVLLHEIPARKGFLDSALQKSLANVAEGDAKTRGMVIGKQAAEAIIANRAGDAADKDPIGVIPPSAGPGSYQPVPPLPFLFAPDWQHMKLFSLKQKDQFRSAPYPALGTELYAKDLKEVKETGKNNSTTRTAEQTSYAKFWYEFSESGWNRVARTVVQAKGLNLIDAARLLALVDMAIADAYVAGWESKMFHNFWRPYTAIRQADIDGNELTTPDAAWEPLEVTPPVQDYPSTHSALGNSAATVLARLLGDNNQFTFASPTAIPAGSTRTFQSFSEAANENADSRVRAGLHFRFSCVAGQEMGTKIGNWTVDNHLKQLK